MGGWVDGLGDRNSLDVLEAAGVGLGFGEAICCGFIQVRFSAFIETGICHHRHRSRHVKTYKKGQAFV